MVIRTWVFPRHIDGQNSVALQQALTVPVPRCPFWDIPKSATFARNLLSTRIFADFRSPSSITAMMKFEKGKSTLSPKPPDKSYRGSLAGLPNGGT
jgi:hypothetical protein